MVALEANITSVMDRQFKVGNFAHFF